MIQLVEHYSSPLKCDGKDEKEAHLPFLSVQTEIKKTNVPLIALMSLHFYLAFQSFPVTLGGMFCLTNLTILLLEAALSFTNLFKVDLIEFSKYVMEINDIHPEETFILSTGFVSTVTHPPILTVIFCISSSLSLLSANLPAKPVGLYSDSDHFSLLPLFPLEYN